MFFTRYRLPLLTIFFVILISLGNCSPNKKNTMYIITYIERDQRVGVSFEVVPTQRGGDLETGKQNEILSIPS